MTEPARTDGSSSAVELTRRQVLASATAIGAIGVAAGGRTGAILTDTESVGANTLAAGAVDLGVCWEAPGDDCEPATDGAFEIDFESLEKGDTGRGSIRLSLPEDVGNNPAWLWLRTRCPSGVCGIYDALEVSMWYDEDCSGDEENDEAYLEAENGTVENVTLCEALTLLSDGIRLDGHPDNGPPDTMDPLEPGTDLCLGIAWEVTRDISSPLDGELSIEFVARQHRHNPAPEIPWDPQNCDPCSETCSGASVPASNVSFCRAGSGSVPPSISNLEWTASTVTWTSEDPLSDVVLFYGPPTFEYFSPPGGFAANTEYTITRGEGDAISLGNAGGAPSDPCPDTGSQGCGVKYEFEEDNWEVVCGQGRPGPRGGEE